MPDGEESSKSISPVEFELRRYEARMGVWKVVFGTLIVGLAGVLIPGAIELYSSYFENQRKAAELDLAKQTAHQQYIKEFFQTAINQDIELRIRFANYFSELSDNQYKESWQGYFVNLANTRNDTRKKINTLEERLYNLSNNEEVEEVLLAQTMRELGWAYNEIGYVPLERSTSPERESSNNKIRLYRETINIIGSFLELKSEIDDQSSDYLRFWQLYKKDLIGVESPKVAGAMVRFGRELLELAMSGGKPNTKLGELGNAVISLMRNEIVYNTRGLPSVPVSTCANC